MSMTLVFAQVPMIHRDAQIEQMIKEISADTLEKNTRKLVSFGTRHSLSNTKSKTQGIGASRNWALEEMKRYAKNSNGRMEAFLDEYTVKADGRRIPKDIQMANVMAVLKGSNPSDDRIFIVSGHIDSRASDIMDAKIAAPGANDDGSGTVAVMELARIMASREFSATIIFVCVQGEEQGLYGARHLAEKAKAEKWNINAMLNNDMIGNSFSSETLLKDNTRLRVFSEGIPALETEEMERLRKSTGMENDGNARQLARYVKEIGERYVDQLEVKLIYRNDRFLRGGDHTPFVQNGFTAVRLCEMNENYYWQHQDVRKENGVQYGDLPEFVDYEYVRKATAVNLATLANLANAPYQPEEVKVDISGLSNTTRLFWKAPEKGKKPNGYYVLVRETDQSQWQWKIFVKDTEAILPYSKDNYLFAVQSVDADGHESLPVWPRPGR